MPSFVRLYIYLFYSFSEDNFHLILHVAFFFPPIILNMVYLISSVWWSRWSTDANHGTSWAACTHFNGTPQSSYGSKQSPWERPWLISCQLSRQWVIQFFSLFVSYCILCSFFFLYLFICIIFLNSLMGENIKERTEILSALPSTVPWKINCCFAIVSQAVPMPFLI